MARVATIAVLGTALLHAAVDARIGLVFDVVFVAVCVGAALWVRPRDFFTIGVMPPLLLAATVLPFAVTDRDTVARTDDVAVQAFVSGLAHHALALAGGYALTLGILALRQVALANRGSLRRTHHAASARPAPEPVAASEPAAGQPTVPQQRRQSAEDARTDAPFDVEAPAPTGSDAR